MQGVKGSNPLTSALTSTYSFSGSSTLHGDRLSALQTRNFLYLLAVQGVNEQLIQRAAIATSASPPILS
jgi:hypothetical protein